MPLGYEFGDWKCPWCSFKAHSLWRPRAYLHAWTHGIWPWRWFELIGSRLPSGKPGHSGWWWKA